MIVEDQTFIREMLVEMVGALPEFEMVAEAARLDDGLRMARRLRPEVVILDWTFPGGGGAAFLRCLWEYRIVARVLVLSAGSEESAIRAALTGGARGYLEKGATLGELLHALRTVAGGGAYFGAAAAAAVERMLKADGLSSARVEQSVQEFPVVVSAGPGDSPPPPSA